MRRRAAFTLVELLFLIAILAVAAVLFFVFFTNGRRSPGSGCMSNLSNIGKGLALYAADNQNRWPWLVSDNRWNAPTGASRFVAPSPTATYNVSSLLFMLVRDNQSSGIFLCPSTMDRHDPNTKEMSNGTAYNWDFSPYRDGNAEHVSYSYQAPMLDANGVWVCGANDLSDPNLVIAADRTPTYDGKTATFNWASPGKADPRTGMSQNHTGGKIINVLYADIHVAEAGRANVGVGGDNIYSCASSTGSPPSPATDGGAGTLNLGNHRSDKDSFLLGPTKMP